jgi:hypothetical protein
LRPARAAGLSLRPSDLTYFIVVSSVSHIASGEAADERDFSETLEADA